MVETTGVLSMILPDDRSCSSVKVRAHYNLEADMTSLGGWWTYAKTSDGTTITTS